MSDPFLSEIRLFAGSFAPRDWALCQGQILPISQNNALFALIGTTYGGDGRTTFGLPDLRGRAILGVGDAPWGSVQAGELQGVEAVTLTSNELATHTHTGVAANGSAEIEVSTDQGSVLTPAAGNYLAAPFFERAVQHHVENYKPTAQATVNVQMGGVTVDPNVTLQPTGGGQSHTNMQPSLGLNYIICINGIFPPRD